MPLPGNWTAVTLTGEFQLYGDPLKGTVTFTPSVWVTNAVANVMQPPGGKRVHLDNDGRFSVPLPVVDDADISPTGWTYRVDLDLVVPSTGFRVTRSFDIQLTAAMAPTVDLADVVPVTVVAEVSPYLRLVDVGTTAGTVAAGNDARIVGAARKAVTQPLLRPVTWRANNLGASTFQAPAGKERASFRVQHRLIQGMRAGGIRLLYANHSGSTATPNSLTVRAHVEINGKGYPVFFGGVRDVTIIPGGHVISDPLPVTVNVVEVPWLYTLTYVDAGTGGRIPIGLATRTTNGEGNNLADTTAGGPDLTVTAYGTNVTNPPFVAAGAYSPMAVLGIPEDRDLPAVCVVGDSISVGAGDGGPAWSSAAPAGDFGFILRPLQDSAGPLIPYLYSAKFGETASSAASIPSRFFRGYAMDYCTDVVEQYGTNDVNAGTTAVNIELYRSQLWMLGKARGRRVWATTITPRTTSSDSWATVGNQTVQVNDAVRVAVNDWLRAGAPLDATTMAPVAVGTVGAIVTGDAAHPLVGYFEIADAVESARNSGRWKAGYTGDGIHPNATASAAMAAVIDPSLFGG